MTPDAVLRDRPKVRWRLAERPDMFEDGGEWVWCIETDEETPRLVCTVGTDLMQGDRLPTPADESCWIAERIVKDHNDALSARAPAAAGTVGEAGEPVAWVVVDKNGAPPLDPFNRQPYLSEAEAVEACAWCNEKPIGDRHWYLRPYTVRPLVYGDIPPAPQPPPTAPGEVAARLDVNAVEFVLERGTARSDELYRTLRGRYGRDVFIHVIQTAFRMAKESAAAGKEPR